MHKLTKQNKYNNKYIYIFTLIVKVIPTGKRYKTHLKKTMKYIFSFWWRAIDHLKYHIKNIARIHSDEISFGQITSKEGSESDIVYCNRLPVQVSRLRLHQPELCCLCKIFFIFLNHPVIVLFPWYRSLRRKCFHLQFEISLFRPPPHELLPLSLLLSLSLYLHMSTVNTASVLHDFVLVRKRQMNKWVGVMEGL